MAKKLNIVDAAVDHKKEYGRGGNAEGRLAGQREKKKRNIGEQF